MLNIIPPISPRSVALALTLGTTLLGFAIAYIAFRGYRQGSRPMLYIAIGFVLVFGVPFTGFIGVVLLPRAPEYVFGLVSGTSRFIGLVSILYGLRMPTDRFR